MPGPLQPPDDGQWKTEDDEVHNDVKCLVHNEEGLFIEALGSNALVPVASQGPTLQRAGEENACAPQSNEANHACRYEPESSGLKYSLVKADDGYFEQRAENEVGELVCKEDLRKSQLIIFWVYVDEISSLPFRNSAKFPRRDLQRGCHCHRSCTLGFEVSLLGGFNIVSHSQSTSSTNIPYKKNKVAKQR